MLPPAWHLLPALGFIGLAACTSVPPPVQPIEPPHPVAQVNLAEQTLERAIRATGQRPPNLARARSLLEGLLAADDPDARALHPYARALLEQLGERQRLTTLNERLTEQLERSTAALEESEQRSATLQRKLDALAEIERSLAPRGPAPQR
ncbi:hypothetical protein [Thauera propionica]|jgi:hypothetical protein|nr:hypothetical protein [Thauera propionica]